MPESLLPAQSTARLGRLLFPPELGNNSICRKTELQTPQRVVLTVWHMLPLHGHLPFDQAALRWITCSLAAMQSIAGAWARAHVPAAPKQAACRSWGW